MAGHSKFKNIMHRKGAQDKKRSAMFSKLSREITVAAKMGLPDPDMNPRLRAAVLAAKAHALLQGRTAPTVEDLKSVAMPILRHRIIANHRAVGDGVAATDIVKHLLQEVAA